MASIEDILLNWSWLGKLVPLVKVWLTLEGLSVISGLLVEALIRALTFVFFLGGDQQGSRGAARLLSSAICGCTSEGAHKSINSCAEASEFETTSAKTVSDMRSECNRTEESNGKKALLSMMQFQPEAPGILESWTRADGRALSWSCMKLAYVSDTDTISLSR